MFCASHRMVRGVGDGGVALNTQLTMSDERKCSSSASFIL